MRVQRRGHPAWGTQRLNGGSLQSIERLQAEHSFARGRQCSGVLADVQPAASQIITDGRSTGRHDRLSGTRLHAVARAKDLPVPRSPDDLPIVAFASQRDWDAWLGASPAMSPGVWLKLARKASGAASISKQEAIETALSYGWIDGKIVSFDEDHWLTRFTPRRANSRWSQNNCRTAAALIAQGRMKPGGLREVERAKADGRWDAAYASPAAATVPDDLATALNRNARARRLFEELDARNRYSILHRIHTAKKAETRARRIADFVAMLARGETIYPRKTKA
jgi:uncharacterized protein YdeI (YjbR/CyaY-like superfamily)